MPNNQDGNAKAIRITCGRHIHLSFQTNIQAVVCKGMTTKPIIDYGPSSKALAAINCKICRRKAKELGFILA